MQGTRAVFLENVSLHKRRYYNNNKFQCLKKMTLIPGDLVAVEALLITGGVISTVMSGFLVFSAVKSI